MALEVVEICAGAGGQVLGLHRAGFTHRFAFELDPNACRTLRANSERLSVSREDWVREGDVADPDLWNPKEFKGIDLLAGGVPCPPFTIAGKQLGATDERDLFAWAVEQVGVVKPKALMLENVRGLSMPRFAGYRQHVLDRLREFGYAAEWRLLHASDFGVPQLRPRFVLVAMKPEDFAYFHWPEREDKPALTVGEALREMLGANGWKGADAWAKNANDIAPTIVGGSKKHGGADLGPTRAKRAWAAMGVDALGVADAAPSPGQKFPVGPKLTADMVARLQGWDNGEFAWTFTGLKTSKYRQIGNAFPPPVAKALGVAIKAALERSAEPKARDIDSAHDPIYRALRDSGDFMTHAQIQRKVKTAIEAHELDRRISMLRQDFDIEMRNGKSEPAYKLLQFKAFLGQEDHSRHDKFQKSRTTIS
ncbi:MAG TPA: DNA (cytosine-5-)-methyltransferase [Micromonosporaceae bacterium]|nr:DNA (cytosine-5-)-methyltransferase [Micromonosporaceae bacterium]HCU50027.1 DNA (cytosine-5-)-methyltransferase [Micromonosporaceae bacterium]